MKATDEIEMRRCDRCGRPLKAQQKRFCSRNCAHLFVWRPRPNRDWIRSR
jgi:hypothetical protein